MISAGEPYLHDVIIADRASLIEGTVAAANLINPRSRYRSRPMTGGGARRIRTDDILLAKQALYQLSYGPSHSVSCFKPRRAGSVASVCRRLVGPIRFELMTSRLSSVRSNQLSYGPIGRIDQILSLERLRPVPGLAIAPPT